MAISYIGSAAGYGGASWSIDLSGLGLQSDDLLLVATCMAYATSYNVAPSTPGYTQLVYAAQAESIDTAVNISYKRMGDAPDATVSFVSDHSTIRGATVVYALRGVDAASPFDSIAPASAQTVNGGIPNAPSISPITAESLVVVFGAQGTQRQLYGDQVCPSGFFDHAISYGHEADSTTYKGNIAVASKIWSGSGPEDPPAWTNWWQDEDHGSVAISIVIRPSSAPVLIKVTGALEGIYALAWPVNAAVVGQYGLLLETALLGRYGDARAAISGLTGRYTDAAAIHAALIGRYNDMIPVLAALAGRYRLMHAVLAGLEGKYAICGSSVLAALDGRYDLRERGEIMAALIGYYQLLPGATVQQIVCPVRIGGVAVRWASVSWTLGEDSYLIEATIVLRDPAEFYSVAKLDTVEIDWSGTTYTLFVAAKPRSRSVSGDPGAAEYGADYTIVARSLTAALDAPYALPVTMSWPATTLASAIAADLIATLSDLITLDWRLEDWLQPGGTFFLTDESPLEGLRKLAGIIGGIAQTSPGNAVILRMEDNVPPAEWATVAPAWTIEDSGLFSDSESEQQSNRYNVITVSNQGESDRSTRFVVEDLADYRKRVKGYRVPWSDFGLATSGGEWVTIENGGVVEELVADEIVEFVDGSSTSALPVYSQVSTVWLQAQLGAITAAEDGSLASEVAGQSLARISYTTRCHVWIGTSDRDEEVQFYEVDL